MGGWLRTTPIHAVCFLVQYRAGAPPVGDGMAGGRVREWRHYLVNKYSEHSSGNFPVFFVKNHHVNLYTNSFYLLTLALLLISSNKLFIFCGSVKQI
jgi:hypothetical protein